MKDSPFIVLPADQVVIVTVRKNIEKEDMDRLITKACEWLKQNMYVEHIFEYNEDENPIRYVCASACDSVDEFVNNFRKAMEG